MAALAWFVLQKVGTTLVNTKIHGAQGVYGTFAVVIGLLFWFSLLAQITLACAEINVVSSHRVWPRGLSSATEERASIAADFQAFSANHVVLLDDDGSFGTRRWSDLDIENTAAACAEAGAPAFVMYTSGSTAAPKAVPLCHRDLVVNGFWIGERMGLSAADRVWLGSPLFWSFGGANALMATLTHGACLVLQDNSRPRRPPR